MILTRSSVLLSLCFLNPSSRQKLCSLAATATGCVADALACCFPVAILPSLFLSLYLSLITEPRPTTPLLNCHCFLCINPPCTATACVILAISIAPPIHPLCSLTISGEGERALRARNAARRKRSHRAPPLSSHRRAGFTVAPHYASPLSFEERGKTNATVGAPLKLVTVVAAVRAAARGSPCRRCHGWSLPSSCALLVELYLAGTGGVALTNGLVSALEERVLHAIPPNEAIDTVEVSGSNLRKGDLLVIAGATLYAISNASDEFLVKNVDRVELMAMLGLFGGIISAIQINILERNELRSIHWSIGTELPFIGFAVAMFMFYSLVPVLLKYKNVAKKYCPPSVPSEYFQN
ncbi:hypothetical protein HN873_044856 [Arachis hypogaea]